MQSFASLRFSKSVVSHRFSSVGLHPCKTPLRTRCSSNRSTMRRIPVAKAIDFETKVFQKEVVSMPGEKESIIRGGRDKYERIPKAFDGIKQIGIIGWGSQAPAQAQNLKDTFSEVGLDIKVAIGLRPESSSNAEAEACGFSKKDGTLGEVFDVVSRSDFVILLISDAAQAKPKSCSRLFAKLTVLGEAVSATVGSDETWIHFGFISWIFVRRDEK